MTLDEAIKQLLDLKKNLLNNSEVESMKEDVEAIDVILEKIKK